MSNQWDDLLTETEKEIIRRSGYGNRRNLGKTPALLIIDAQYNFFGARKPIMEQLEEYPTGVGIEAWRNLDRTVSLLARARETGIPVIYTRYVAQDSGNSHESKMKRDHSKFSADSHGSQIVAELKPAEGDVLIDKNYASAFFGTSLINHLVGRSIDTLIIVGGTTSGCVRSTAIDSSNFGFNTALVSDCVFDRISVSHKVALLDIWMKYGSVLSSVEIEEYFGSLKKEKM